MKTNVLTTTYNPIAQNVLNLSKEKCAVVMALILLSSANLAFSADNSSIKAPQLQRTSEISNKLKSNSKTPTTTPLVEGGQSCEAKVNKLREKGLCAKHGSGLKYCLAKLLRRQGDIGCANRIMRR